MYVWQKLQNVDHIYSGKGDTGAAISVVQFNICNDYNYYNLAERKKKNFDFFFCEHKSETAVCDNACTVV